MKGMHSLAMLMPCAKMCTFAHMEYNAMATSTMTIRLSDEIKGKLERLSDETRRSRSFLAADAISAYVERELAIVEGIKRGLADMQAGRVVPHEQVMAEARQIIAKAKNASRKTANG
jgi:predicted transcriptional regulator